MHLLLRILLDVELVGLLWWNLLHLRGTLLAFFGGTCFVCVELIDSLCGTCVELVVWNSLALWWNLLLCVELIGPLVELASFVWNSLDSLVELASFVWNSWVCVELIGFCVELASFQIFIKDFIIEYN